MSFMLYAFAACTYLAANWLALKIAIAEWQSGNHWLVPWNLFANPIQTKRFLGFGALLFITFLAVITGSKLEH
jgi:hypothetical protein